MFHCYVLYRNESIHSCTQKAKFTYTPNSLAHSAVYIYVHVIDVSRRQLRHYYSKPLLTMIKLVFQFIYIQPN